MSDTIGVQLEHDDEMHMLHEHRLQRRRQRMAGRIGLNLTAMIDVVFLLLVYFLVATEFKLGEEVYRLDLPQRGTAISQPDPFELDEEPLRIEVASVGIRPDDYRIRLVGPYEQPRSFEALRDWLRDKRIGAGVRTGLFAPDHPIIVQPLESARWEHAMEAFNAAAVAEFTNITFAAAK